jgi:peptide/nickel transport system substrate-binding protein
MPFRSFRRAVTLVALSMGMLAMPACRNKPSGEVNALLIGRAPVLRDPTSARLSANDEVLLSAVAQGLVSFDASGNIVGGLAERWNVSDDGQSYIFRLAAAEWPDGSKITAKQVARALKRTLAPRSANSMKDALGAVEDIVAMTDRVIEIRLSAPRPNLLALLAQPSMAVLHAGRGSGPFRIEPTDKGESAGIRLFRETAASENSPSRSEIVMLGAAPTREAVAAFVRGRADVVLGGTFADLPVAQSARLPRGSLRFDPASGLFGLVPVASRGPAADPKLRTILAQAIDRRALIASFNVPGLAARTTLLEPRLDGVSSVVEPAWAATPLAERQARLAAEASRLLEGTDERTLRISLPEGPGADRLLARLQADWAPLGFIVERSESLRGADFRVIDSVAPSTSPAWFVRSFRCGVAAICDPEADELMDAARTSPVPSQRYALLTQAAAKIDDARLFIPIAAPVRWSLVTARVRGFAGNRNARHTLVDLEQPLAQGGQ